MNKYRKQACETLIGIANDVKNGIDSRVHAARGVLEATAGDRDDYGDQPESAAIGFDKKDVEENAPEIPRVQGSAAPGAPAMPLFQSETHDKAISRESWTPFIHFDEGAIGVSVGRPLCVGGAYLSLKSTNRIDWVTCLQCLVVLRENRLCEAKKADRMILENWREES